MSLLWVACVHKDKTIMVRRYYGPMDIVELKEDRAGVRAVTEPYPAVSQEEAERIGREQFGL